ncbi:hypothetical protein V1523DRAFT_393163 [Lipomyces doorenjongii]
MTNGIKDMEVVTAYLGTVALLPRSQSMSRIWLAHARCIYDSNNHAATVIAPVTKLAANLKPRKSLSSLTVEILLSSTQLIILLSPPLNHTSDIMRPVVSLGYAWCCTVLSVFGIVILCAIAGFFLSGSEAFLGSTMDPPSGQP